MRYRIKILFAFILFIQAAFIAGCGEGDVNLSEASYIPKIVINAYIYGGQKVQDIKVSRNVPLNQGIDTSKIFLTDAIVSITDLSSSKKYLLTYNPLRFSFEYAGTDLIIGYGKSYKIDVQAIIDGKNLYAVSTTTVPLSGLKADKQDLGIMAYRETDVLGNIEKINVSFRPSDNSAATILSIVSLEASPASFIYNNYYYLETDTQKIDNALYRYSQNFTYQLDIASGTSDFTIPIDWFTIWFYGRYRVIIYAADKNFYDYFITAKNVMELDGNFHDPRMHIDGDGIGVFGSAVTDTVYFTITK
jgi:hypothetical protein